VAHFSLLAFLTLVVSEFGWLIGSLSFAMRALHLQTFWRQLRFLGEKIVRQCVSYFRMREQLVAALTLQDPFRHWPDTRIKPTRSSSIGNTLISVAGA
jgi:hypothetical protein